MSSELGCVFMKIMPHIETYRLHSAVLYVILTDKNNSGRNHLTIKADILYPCRHEKQDGTQIQQSQESRSFQRECGQGSRPIVSSGSGLF